MNVSQSEYLAYDVYFFFFFGLLLSSLQAFCASLLNSRAVKRFEFQQRLLSICPVLSRWTVLTFCSVTGK